MLFLQSGSPNMGSFGNTSSRFFHALGVSRRDMPMVWKYLFEIRPYTGASLGVWVCTLFLLSRKSDLEIHPQAGGVLCLKSYLGPKRGYIFFSFHFLSSPSSSPSNPPHHNDTLQIREFSEKLEKYGVSIASNQVEYSLVNQDADEDGTLAECNRLGEKSREGDTAPLHRGTNWLVLLVYVLCTPTEFVFVRFYFFLILPVRGLLFGC